MAEVQQVLERLERTETALVAANAALADHRAELVRQNDRFAKLLEDPTNESRQVQARQTEHKRRSLLDPTFPPPKVDRYSVRIYGKVIL